MMLEFGDANWTVIVQFATSLLLQRLMCVTSVPCGIWSMSSSTTGYHRHGTSLYVPSWDIPNRQVGKVLNKQSSGLRHFLF